MNHSRQIRAGEVGPAVFLGAGLALALGVIRDQLCRVQTCSTTAHRVSDGLILFTAVLSYPWLLQWWRLNKKLMLVLGAGAYALAIAELYRVMSN
jgi:hypothetical protein